LLETKRIYETNARRNSKKDQVCQKRTIKCNKSTGKNPKKFLEPGTRSAAKTRTNISYRVNSIVLFVRILKTTERIRIYPGKAINQPLSACCSAGRYLKNAEGQLVRVHIFQIFAQLVVQEPGDQSLQHDLRECKTFFLKERDLKKSY
jgi:hypothetical protein